ncbi:MAG: hypothetical protein K2F95_03020 [Alistipes sp.]|nr:hypothetical protein [Alistipes sp.]
MRALNFILGLAIAAFGASGCASTYGTSSSSMGDLYTSNNKTMVARRIKEKAELQKAEAEARQAKWEAMLAEANAASAEQNYYASTTVEPSYDSVLADTYESAYARRLYGFNSPTYRMPSSYYSLSANRAYWYASAYDPAFYNVMVSGDQVWVEPRYITSMFGSWGATNVTFGLYSSPWNWGWNFRVDPFYYSWWGYPHYSWYDWNWNICYHPHYDWWWGGHYPHHGWHGGIWRPTPPMHRPTLGSWSNNRPNTNINGNRYNSGSRYNSPVTRTNYGGSTSSRRSGSTASGIYQGGSGSNRGGSYGTSTGNSNGNRYNGGTRTDRGSSTGTAGSGNYRQSGSSNSGSSSNYNRGTTTRGSSTSNNNRNSSSSNNRNNSSSSYRQNNSSNSGSSYRSSGSSTRSSGSSGGSYRSGGSSGSGSYRSGGGGGSRR